MLKGVCPAGHFSTGVQKPAYCPLLKNHQVWVSLHGWRSQVSSGLLILKNHYLRIKELSLYGDHVSNLLCPGEIRRQQMSGQRKPIDKACCGGQKLDAVVQRDKNCFPDLPKCLMTELPTECRVKTFQNFNCSSILSCRHKPMPP